MFRESGRVPLRFLGRLIRPFNTLWPLGADGAERRLAMRLIWQFFSPMAGFMSSRPADLRSDGLALLALAIGG
jgi:hypothetical protein